MHECVAILNSIPEDSRLALYYRNTSLWNRSIQLSHEIYKLVPMLPREEMYGMRSQLTRAVVSVATNIAEGWSRETDRDRAHFLAMSHGSLAETETLLTICETLSWMTTDDTSTARGLITEISKMLATLRGKHRDKLNAQDKQ